MNKRFTQTYLYVQEKTCMQVFNFLSASAWIELYFKKGKKS